MTGRGELRFASPPVRLSGGYYAELLRFRLADPPPGLDLDGDLVARIVPDPIAGVWEATVQQAVAEQGFATPSVRLTVAESSPLGRFLVVMDAVDGAPPLAGLGVRSVVTGLPDLVRHLPKQLARIAAGLHGLDVEPLQSRLTALDDPARNTVAGYVGQMVDDAEAYGRPGLAAAGRALLAAQPVSVQRVITHGDLHPFNLLVSGDATTLIDRTNARVADPAFTVGFTQFVLANPPVPLPKVGAAAVRLVGGRMGRRFLATYRGLTDGTPGAVDDVHLAWHRRVHALRILVELAGRVAAGDPPDSDHPWIVLEPAARNELGLRADRSDR